MAFIYGLSFPLLIVARSLSSSTFITLHIRSASPGASFGCFIKLFHCSEIASEFLVSLTLDHSRASSTSRPSSALGWNIQLQVYLLFIVSVLQICTSWLNNSKWAFCSIQPYPKIVFAVVKVRCCLGFGSTTSSEEVVIIWHRKTKNRVWCLCRPGHQLETISCLVHWLIWRLAVYRVSTVFGLVTNVSNSSN